MFSDSFSRWRKHRSGDIDNFNEVNISRKNKKSKYQNSVLLLQRKTECSILCRDHSTAEQSYFTVTSELLNYNLLK